MEIGIFLLAELLGVSNGWLLLMVYILFKKENTSLEFFSPVLPVISIFFHQKNGKEGLWKKSPPPILTLLSGLHISKLADRFDLIFSLPSLPCMQGSGWVTTI